MTTYEIRAGETDANKTSFVAHLTRLADGSDATDFVYLETNNATDIGIIADAAWTHTAWDTDESGNSSERLEQVVPWRMIWGRSASADYGVTDFNVSVGPHLGGGLYTITILNASLLATAGMRIWIAFGGATLTRTNYIVRILDYDPAIGVGGGLSTDQAETLDAINLRSASTVATLARVRFAGQTGAEFVRVITPPR